jgi:hypothetical protein
MRAVFCATLVLLGACAQRPPSEYAWGNYENLVYVSYAAPGKISPELEAAQLESDRLNAQAAKKPMPPGWHAHLGYVYVQVGRLDLAERELIAEKTAYPESTVFVDQLLENLKRP